MPGTRVVAVLLTSLALALCARGAEQKPGRTDGCACSETASPQAVSEEPPVCICLYYPILFAESYWTYAALLCAPPYSWLNCDAPPQTPTGYCGELPPNSCNAPSGGCFEAPAREGVRAGRDHIASEALKRSGLPKKYKYDFQPGVSRMATVAGSLLAVIDFEKGALPRGQTRLYAKLFVVAYQVQSWADGGPPKPLETRFARVGVEVEPFPDQLADFATVKGLTPSGLDPAEGAKESRYFFVRVPGWGADEFRVITATPITDWRQRPKEAPLPRGRKPRGRAPSAQ